MDIKFLIGDISLQDTEAIVNAANRSLLGGGGVDGAIHRAAGPELFEECKKIAPCSTGEAKLTRGYKLKAKYIIHTVGPVYKKGSSKQEELLASCYKNSLILAMQNKIKSISFPSISTGAYRYPADEASSIALRTVLDFLKNKQSFLKELRFVLFTEKLYDIFVSAFNSLKTK